MCVICVLCVEESGQRWARLCLTKFTTPKGEVGREGGVGRGRPGRTKTQGPNPVHAYGKHSHHSTRRRALPPVRVWVWVCGLRVLEREMAAPFSFSVQTTTLGQTTTLAKRACFPSDHTTSLVHAHSTAATEQSHCCRGGDKAGGGWPGIKRQAAKGQGRDHRRKKAGEAWAILALANSIRASEVGTGTLHSQGRARISVDETGNSACAWFVSRIGTTKRRKEARKQGRKSIVFCFPSLFSAFSFPGVGRLNHQAPMFLIYLPKQSEIRPHTSRLLIFLPVYCFFSLAIIL